MRKLIVLALPVLGLATACSGGTQIEPRADSGTTSGFVQAMAGLPVDPFDPETIQVAEAVCDSLGGGVSVSDIVDTISWEWEWSAEDAVQFIAASVHGYCPDAIQ